MKEDNSYNTAKELFTRYLIAKKHRKTPERYAILERIYNFEGHFNAETLHQTMQSDYRVSLATVYNTLELLLDCHLLVKHSFDTHKMQYEKTLGNTAHHHLLCTKCGKIKSFADKGIRVAIRSKRFSTFSPTQYSLYVYGVCKDCEKES